MGLFSRAHDIMQAKANRALDKAEKPDEMLDLSYEKMLEQITQVRKALVEIAASRKRIELQESQLQASADHLQEQAKAALGAGREDLAREALSRKAAALQQVAELDPQHQQLVDEEAKLTQTLQSLQARVNQFRTQKETLKAQYSAAQAMTTVNEGVAGISKSISDSVRRSQGHRTRSRTCRLAPARWTNFSSRGCSRTSAAAMTTSRRSWTRSAPRARSTRSWPPSKPVSLQRVPSRRPAATCPCTSCLRSPSTTPPRERRPTSERPVLRPRDGVDDHPR